MSEATEDPYKVARVSVVVKGADTLVREYVLEPGEVISWHHHTEVTDFYYGLEGTTLVETREPPTHHEVEPGARASVTPPTVHRVIQSDRSSVPLPAGPGRRSLRFRESRLIPLALANVAPVKSCGACKRMARAHATAVSFWFSSS